MERVAPTPVYAFALALIGGALLASGHYVGGAIAVLGGLCLYALWLFARERGDDDRGVY